MDYPKLDKVRRSATPMQLDVVEAFAAGSDEPPRVHPARDGRRPVDGLDQRGHRRLRCRGLPERERRRPVRPASAGAGGRAAASAAVAGGTIRVAVQRPVSVDPVAMQDLGGYGITAQSFEFLCAQNTTGDPGGLSPGLALEWAPNADGTVWTFKLRQDAKWQHDGSPFTSADVVATMERLVAAGNSGLKGVLDAGGAVATDANTVTFTLVGANGNFPYLVSIYNAQTLITPVDYVAGTKFDARPTGTGAWKLMNYNQQTGATFERNPDWWGGQTPLDGTEFIFFDATGPMITAYQGDQVDAIVQFDVLTGASLFDDPNFSLIATAGGPPSPDLDADRHGRVRQEARSARRSPNLRPAGADPAAVQGSRRARQRPRHLAGLPVLRHVRSRSGRSTSRRPRPCWQRPGATSLTATLHAGELQEIPDLAVAPQEPGRRRPGSP